MTPTALMRRRAAAGRTLELVIFDCDGVLIDSETVANRVVAEALTGLGWSMSAAESQRRFLGMSLPDMVPVIEATLGHALPPGWTRALSARLITALKRDVVAVEGARDMLVATSDIGVPWRIASNSSRTEMAVKFEQVGLTSLVQGRLHSFEDVARGKPAPDLFLAAAAAQGVAPSACLVVEDSVLGARGAATAGMDCLGYAPRGDAPALRAAGAALVHRLADLPPLFAADRMVSSVSAPITA